MSGFDAGFFISANKYFVLLNIMIFRSEITPKLEKEKCREIQL